MSTQVQCVSFPRSGHHLLTNLLLTYHSGAEQRFDHDGMSAQQTCTTVQGAGRFYYCEQYSHCRETPCPDFRAVFQKEHDWALASPHAKPLAVDPGARYVIMYRDPLASITSLFRGGPRSPTASRERWQAFATHHMNYWRMWARKWLLPKHSNALYISYEQLIAKPLEYLAAAVDWIFPGTFDQAVGVATVSMYDIRERNRVEDFKWYDREFFDSLRATAEDELVYLRGVI